MTKLIVLAIVFSFILFSCGKKDEVKKESNFIDELKDVQYGLTPFAEDNHFLKYVVPKSDVNNDVLTIEIRYTNKDDQYVKELSDTKEKVGKYPVTVSKFEKVVYVGFLLPNRVTIKIIPSNKSTGRYQDPEFLKKFITLFDTVGLEKISGDMIKGAELEKYFPKL